MIVSEVMKTSLITVTPEDSLGHAANLLRQYQFHHLPVVRAVKAAKTGQHPSLSLEAMLTTTDIDLAVALEAQHAPGEASTPPWQERSVAEVMHRAPLYVNPSTDLAAAAQLLVERGLNFLPVVEYELADQKTKNTEQEIRPLLVGLITRSDILLAFARAMGAYEPGMRLRIRLRDGDLTPLVQALQFALQLHIAVRSVMAAPMQGSTPQSAVLWLGTIHPAPLLVHLRQANIQYSVVSPLVEDSSHG